MDTYIKSYNTSIALSDVAWLAGIIFFFNPLQKNNNDYNNNIISFLLDGGKNQKKHLHKLEPTDGRSRVCFSTRTKSFFV